MGSNTDTPYKVEHYIEKLEEPKNDQSAEDIQNPEETEKPEKEYILAETEDLKGTTDSSVTPAVKDYPGFTAPETQTVTILADGSTYVRYEYSRMMLRSHLIQMAVHFRKEQQKN